MDRGAWWATAHRFAKSWTTTEHAHTQGDESVCGTRDACTFFLKLCTNDYITTLYLAGGHVSPSCNKNLLTNPVILSCILWEWVW